MAVITAWIVAAISGVLRLKNKKPIIAISYLSVVVFSISCIAFIVFSCLSLYHEILRHQKIIKTRSTNIAKRTGKIRQGVQSTQDNRVCGRYRSAVLSTCGFVLALKGSKLVTSISAFIPWIRIFPMLNSPPNWLIYCWRQEEMRKFAFIFMRKAHEPSANFT